MGVVSILGDVWKEQRCGSGVTVSRMGNGGAIGGSDFFNFSEWIKPVVQYLDIDLLFVILWYKRFQVHKGTTQYRNGLVGNNYKVSGSYARQSVFAWCHRVTVMQLVLQLCQSTMLSCVNWLLSITSTSLVDISYSRKRTITAMGPGGWFAPELSWRIYIDK